MTTLPQPDTSLPGPPTIAGDHADDDGPVLDSLVEQSAEPPAPKPATAPPVAPAPTPDRPRTPSRLLTGSMTINDSHGAVLLLPADPDRKNLSLSVMSAGTPDAPVTPEANGVRIAEDSGRVMTDGASLVLPNGRNWDSVPGYTGAVWAAVTGVGTLFVTWAAVTR